MTQRIEVEKGSQIVWASLVVLILAATLRGEDSPPARLAPTPRAELPLADEPNPGALNPEAAADAPAGGSELDQLLELADEDIGHLAEVQVTAPSLAVEVTTVSRQKSTVGRSPAAVFVITNEMIQRSGARSIPEVLRMAPGVNVARIDASNWAISIRGFNNRFANKLLVQIDGRSVYTPLFGGVFWDVQDVLLEDVERIEVIRGPGATVWGANAVNGIINIITKSAHKTRGKFVEAGGGTEERGFASARVGGGWGEDASYRVYAKWFERDAAYDPTGLAADDWRQKRAGFRFDWDAGCFDAVTLQGDWYEGTAGGRNIFPDPTPPLFIRDVIDDTDVAGGNVLFRWTRELANDSDWSVQMYYDRTERNFRAAGLQENRDTFDIDFSYRLPPTCGHKAIWGLRFRNTSDNIDNAPFLFEFDPSRRRDDLYSFFIQDEITLAPKRLFFTTGVKLQHNNYSGFEAQPTARLLWTPSDRQSIWAAFSRAVRTPTRADDDVRITLSPPAGGPPVFPVILGNRDFESEVLLAYEAGIRVQPFDHFSWDLALFYHQYDDLRDVRMLGVDFGPPPVALQQFVNGGSGDTYGFEIFATYQVSEFWKLYGTYSFFRESLRPATLAEAHTTPRNQAYLQSSWNIGCRWECDLIWRYSDSVFARGVPSYNVMDARLAWHPTELVEVAVVGRNLLDAEHREPGFDDGAGIVPTEVQREVYGVMTWRY